MANLNKQELITHLRKLGNGEILPHSTDCGLCTELDYLCGWKDTYSTILKNNIPDWPLWSEDFSYYIKHKSRSPKDAYNSFYSLWEISEQSSEEDKEYIQNRLNLCLWFADFLESYGELDDKD